ncbi:MAG: hypothetical protein HY819_03290 [Acidobacteria bacterium]|nr:hypothetical protein [Acidobacteriota bacterium]
MIRKILFLSLLVNLVFFISSSMGQNNSQYTKIPRDAKISEYTDKKIKLGGKPAIDVNQHPVLTATATLGKQEFQSYLDTKFGQLIIISKEEIKCSGKVKVFGKLEKVSLRGAKNTKSSYEGYVIRADKCKCK